MNSEWHDIPGCPGYRGSEDGQIYDIKRGRIKKQRRASNGAMKVEIGKSTRMVHDLIARAFYGRPLTRGYRVKHLNGNLSDNRPENLVWAGFPVLNTQPPALPSDLEEEYDRVRNERLALVELMQT